MKHPPKWKFAVMVWILHHEYRRRNRSKWRKIRKKRCRWDLETNEIEIKANTAAKFLVLEIPMEQ